MAQNKNIGHIKRVDINGLFGIYNFSIPFDEGKLILVGENGTGKSTVVSILYYLLTRQWRKLLNYDFKDVSVFIKNQKVSVSKINIQNYIQRSKLRHHYPNRFYDLVSNELAKLGINYEIDINKIPDSLYNRLANELRAPREAIKRIIFELTQTGDGDNKINESDTKLIQNFNLPILFLPTYRRIERDLTTIFPNLEDNFNKMQERYQHEDTSNAFLELVEFGMEDINRMIDKTLISFNTDLRKGLDTLTGEYLREVLRKEYENVDIAPIQNMEMETLDNILSRIDEKILPVIDQKRLRATINSFKERSTIKVEDKVVAHFLTKLLKLHQEQFEREQSVRALVDVCNKYLKGKQLFFDNISYSLPIVPTIQKSKSISTIKLKDLSSGEKQIVSLFTHLYLSKQSSYFVIIDEPELSLSVPWQKQLLPDIIKTGKCDLLLAVTHSPFIYDNELSMYAHSISEFMES